jgi:hypothetical protein
MHWQLGFSLDTWVECQFTCCLATVLSGGRCGTNLESVMEKSS